MLSSTLEITSLSLGKKKYTPSYDDDKKNNDSLSCNPRTLRHPLPPIKQEKKIKNHALLHHPLNSRHPPPPPPPHHHHLRHPQNHSSSTRSSSSRKTTFFQTKTPKLALFLLLRQQRWRTTLRGHHMHDLDRRTRRRDEFQKSHCGV